MLEYYRLSVNRLIPDKSKQLAEYYSNHNPSHYKNVPLNL